MMKELGQSVRRIGGGVAGLAGGFSGEKGGLIRKTVVTVALLAFIYWGITTLVAWITAPRIDMSMSPVTGRIAVVAEPAKGAPIARRVTYTGSIASYQDVTVYPRVEGWVQEFRLYEGDRVETGQSIARLDRAELTAQWERAQASAAAARRERPVIQSAIEAHRASLAAAKASLLGAQASVDFWAKELQRFDVLATRNAIAESAFDDARRQAQAVQAALAERAATILMHESRLREAEGQPAALDERIKAAESEAERMRTVLSYADIPAPISGRVTKRHIYAGILVRPGMPIVDLQDISRVRVQVKVGEKDLPHIRPGQEAQGTEAVVRFPALAGPQQERRARVTRVFPQLDPVTRTATVEILLDNPSEQIKPDMYAVVDLILERKGQALTIPREAVLEGPDKKPIVYVTDGVTAMSRPVTLGIAEGDRIEVLDGVREGEMVVSKGQRNLSEGAQVAPVQAL